MAYYVYLLTNERMTVLYIGMTNDLERRVYEHKKKFVDGFTRKYNLDRLVYFEEADDVTVAIEREKQLKGWLRRRKAELVETMNPEWRDLAADWYD
ncbi:MAG TPA: GIY-YIG nuclease family protein [Dehalococcoidia bacterium]|nr:GIY-YIG nuclease family protein [Dehalococcoidia bacterium]